MAATKAIKFRGQDEMIANLNKIAKKYPTKVKRALYMWGERVMTRAKQLTPVGGPPFSPNDVAPGTLRASGLVTPADGEKIGITLSFGGAAQDYAVAQHENEYYRHHVGQSGFLVEPLMEAAGSAARDIAADCQLDEDDKE